MAGGRRPTASPHSVYLYGPIPRGTAVPARGDLGRWLAGEYTREIGVKEPRA
jgi:hypothetical protein